MNLDELVKASSNGVYKWRMNKRRERLNRTSFYFFKRESNLFFNHHTNFNRLVQTPIKRKIK
jgi:hypothetical protein